MSSSRPWYRIPDAERAFAHALVDAGGADIVHGHSSHHAKGIEIHCGKPLIYGCGDFLTDYEGIAGHEQYRGDLSLMYFVDLDVESREVVELTLVPLHLERFALHRAAAADLGWIRDMLTHEGAALGTRAEPLPDYRLSVRWT
jgi:poly-gamma-glutamate capsule biosynthesis protein CapA/YwtB (metallophosphatase superfamily)